MFLEANLSYLTSRVYCLGKVLVLLDIRNGLVADLMIKRGNKCFCQPLDYVGVPFRCIRCHGHGNLASHCSISFHNQLGSALKKNFVWRVKRDVGLSEFNSGDLLGKAMDVSPPDVSSLPTDWGWSLKIMF